MYASGTCHAKLAERPRIPYNDTCLFYHSLDCCLEVSSLRVRDGPGLQVVVQT